MFGSGVGIGTVVMIRRKTITLLGQNRATTACIAAAVGATPRSFAAPRIATPARRSFGSTLSASASSVLYSQLVCLSVHSCEQKRKRSAATKRAGREGRPTAKRSGSAEQTASGVEWGEDPAHFWGPPSVYIPPQAVEIFYVPGVCIKRSMVDKRKPGFWLLTQPRDSQAGQFVILFKLSKRAK